MTDVRKIHVDWYAQHPPRFNGGPQLACQGDHLSNMVIFDHAPELPNYYLLVEMKTDDAGPVVTLPEIRLEGPYWVIPNYYTQICQKITYQVCCKTESGDFEHHSAKFEGTILPVIKHNGEPIDQSPMFDPYIDILDKRMSKLILDADVKEVDSELKSDSGNPVQNRVIKAKIDEIDENAIALNGRLQTQETYMGAKNMLDIKDGTYTQNGVTFAWTNGIANVSGTSTGYIYYDMRSVYLYAGRTYAVHGPVENMTLQVITYDRSQTIKSVTTASTTNTFTVPEDGRYFVRFYATPNKTFDNVTFAPMVTYSDADEEFAPYAMPNRELTENIKTVSEEAATATANVEALSTYINSVGIYPFTADSTLYRPGYPAQLVYSQKMNGIKNLVVYAPDSKDYYVSEMYAYGNGKSSLVITNGQRTGYYSKTRSAQTDRPTENITIYDGNGVLLAEALVDWSKIYLANGLGLTAESTKIQEACIMRTGTIRFLPLTDIYVTNVQQRVYFNELCRGAKGGYFVATANGATYPEVTYTDRYVQFDVKSNKTFTVTVAYKDEGVTLAAKSLTVHCNISALPAKKYMFIGDSYTAAGYMQKWFKDTNPDTVTLYGTLGTSPYLHEGRSGWSVNDYFTASKSGVSNPFYNPSSQTFDFAYYIDNHPGFTDVDVVNILLGRNNSFAVAIIANIQRIINSIHAYNENILITVMVGSNVAADNSGAGKSMQSADTFNLACFRYNEKASYTDAEIVYQNLNLDNVYDFSTEEVNATLSNPKKVTVYTDNVHPSRYGYESFGVAYNGYMHNRLNQ